MPFTPAEDTVQVEFLVTSGNQQIQNVLHYDAEGAWGIAEMQSFGTSLITWWVNNIRVLCASSVSLRAVRLTDMRADVGPVVEVNGGLPSVGTGASPSLPNSVSTVITKRTALRGRSYRGRIYTYGMMESQMDVDAINGAVTTAYINAWTAAKTFTVGAFTFYMCVVSRFQNNQQLANAVVTRVLNFTSDGVVDSQRRRLAGRGR